MLEKFCLRQEIFAIKAEIDEALKTARFREKIIEKFPELFDTSTTGLGKLNTMKVTWRVNDDKPVFLKARKAPFAITQKWETALKELE